MDVLCAYVAIRIAAEVDAPIGKADVDRALGEILSPRMRFCDRESYEIILATSQARARLSLARLEIDFYLEKLAYDTDQYSRTGILYAAARRKRGPLSSKEREEFTTLASEHQRLEEELEALRKDEVAEALSAHEAPPPFHVWSDAWLQVNADRPSIEACLDEYIERYDLLTVAAGEAEDTADRRTRCTILESALENTDPDIRESIEVHLSKCRHLLELMQERDAVD